MSSALSLSRHALLSSALALLSSNAFAWNAQDADQALQQVIEQVRDHYVIEDDRAAIVKALEQAWQRHEIKLDNPDAFAGDVTELLRSVNGDGHLSLSHDPQRYAALVAPNQDGSQQPPEESLAYWEDQARAVNWGFGQLQWLPGRIGYLDLTGFWDLGDSYASADAAMRFLAAADAIIIDLRHNGGGSAAMVRYLISYFIDDSRELMRFDDSYSNSSRYSYALDHVPGPRLTDKPLYVLIGGATGSAAEEFASHVSLFKLGELIGEASYGAAHNNIYTGIAPDFALSLSIGRPVHPVSGGNWEGKGVPPSVEIAAEDALGKAQELALQNLLAKAEKEALDEKRQIAYRWAIERIHALNKEAPHSSAQLAAMAGQYSGDRRIELRGEHLYLKRGRRPAQELIAIDQETFAPADGASARIRFHKSGKNYTAFEWFTPGSEATRFERQ